MLQESAPRVKLNPIVDYIDGKIAHPADILPASVGNPNTNEPLQQQRSTNAEMVEQALAAAQRVHANGDWRNLSPEEKSSTLNAIASRLEKRLDEIAQVESLTTGVIIRQTHAFAQLIPQAFQQTAQQVSLSARPVVVAGRIRVERPPWGPAALLCPWSASAVTAAQKIASALAAGCPVILKPSEWSPHACGILAEVINSAGLPKGTFQMVNGGADVGSTLVADPRIKVVSFTGSLESGRAIAQLCAQHLKPAQLEINGMNPLIVLEDANLDQAVEAIVVGLTALNGQWSCGVGRLLIHIRHYHALLKRLVKKLDTLTIGDSLSAESEMGPLIHTQHLHHMQTMAQRLLDGGGIIHESATLPDLPGYFMRPTLITNCPPETAAETMFGPMAAVYFFKNEAEAVALANQPDSARVAYIFSANDQNAYRVARNIRASYITINAVSLLGPHPQVPRSGWGLTGLGEVGLTESIRFFTGTQAIGIPART